MAATQCIQTSRSGKDNLLWLSIRTGQKLDLNMALQFLTDCFDLMGFLHIILCWVLRECSEKEKKYSVASSCFVENACQKSFDILVLDNMKATVVQITTRKICSNRRSPLLVSLLSVRSRTLSQLSSYDPAMIKLYRLDCFKQNLFKSSQSNLMWLQ